MYISQPKCRKELEDNGLIPKKYHGQVFTTDEKIIDKLIETIKSIYKPGTKIVEIGGGLGYITEKLSENFEDIDVLEIDEELFRILNFKLNDHLKIKNLKLKILKEDIMDYKIPKSDYLLVGNIPFHISGKLYRRFMSDEKHKPYGMVFITDKQYATTLMGQPPRSYRVSLQAQAYGDIEIIADVPKTSVYPEPKVMSCIMKITHNPTPMPKNFWEVVNYHFENFPTKEVESPKTMSLKDWIKLCKS
jgi:16S rRNA (adenine1518-N6/adenine1519-N6)-dimethyltransferase